MKYYHDKDALDVAIEKYEIERGKIIITFLDGNKYYIKHTADNEKKLLKIMKNQAKDRRDSNALRIIKSNKHLSGFSASFEIFAMASTIPLALVVSSVGGFTILGIVDLALIPILKHEIGRYNSLGKVEEELEKYELYLSIEKDLEKQKYNPNLYNGLNNKLFYINFNTLDRYSLQTIEKLRDNLYMCNKFSDLEVSDYDRVYTKSRDNLEEKGKTKTFNKINTDYKSF